MGYHIDDPPFVSSFERKMIQWRKGTTINYVSRTSDCSTPFSCGGDLEIHTFIHFPGSFVPMVSMMTKR